MDCKVDTYDLHSGGAEVAYCTPAREAVCCFCAMLLAKSVCSREDVCLLQVVQNRITAFWFKGKELALAFGLTLSFSRLGSVLNFFFTQQFEARFGMQWTLWAGEFLWCFGLLFSRPQASLFRRVMKSTSKRH